MRSLVAAIAASFLLAGCSGSSGDGGAGGPVCGDGIVSAPEVCDGPALGGKDCTTVPGGFVRGTLACAADCTAFDTAGCAGPACGDGIVSAPEVCDGADLGGKDCTTIPGGYVGGEHPVMTVDEQIVIALMDDNYRLDEAPLDLLLPAQELISEDLVLGRSKFL